MRRALLPWLAMFGIALALGVTAIVVLNATAFGAGGFVRIYLDALARGDAESALGIAGVDVPEDVSEVLLRDDVLTGLGDIREVSDVETAGVHHVTVAWDSPEGAGETTFAVERVGTRFGLFPEWRFAETPIATLSLTVLHDERFTVNGVAAVSGIAANEPGAYAVLAPGSYLLGHDTEFLVAEPVPVVVASAAEPIVATVEVLAGDRFAEQVTAEVTAYLDDCVTQEVLFPSACPFGQSIANRVISTPRWTMVEYPELVVQPGTEFGTWEIPSADATAHLVVDVQSLFDGSVTTFDEDVPFDVHYIATIMNERELLIVAQ